MAKDDDRIGPALVFNNTDKANKDPSAASIDNGEWSDNVYRVITLKRAHAAGAFHGNRADFGKKATFNNPNPFSMFLPCLSQSITEFHQAFTKYRLTSNDLDQAVKCLNTLIDNKNLTKENLTKELALINTELESYLLSIMDNQYNRGDTNAATRAYSLTDNYTLWQKWDLAQIWPKLATALGVKKKYFLGEMIATIKRANFYKDINYGTDNQKDPAKATEFWYSRKDPNNPDDPTKEERLITGKYDKDAQSITLTMAPSKDDADFASKLQHMLIFTAQYAQQNNQNTFPVKLGDNPERNIFTVMQAVGEFGLHVPLSKADQDRVSEQIEKMQDKTPEEKKELQELWTFASNSAHTISSNFAWNKPANHAQAKQVQAACKETMQKYKAFFDKFTNKQSEPTLPPPTTALNLS